MEGDSDGVLEDNRAAQARSGRQDSVLRHDRFVCRRLGVFHNSFCSESIFPSRCSGPHPIRFDGSSHWSCVRIRGVGVRTGRSRAYPAAPLPRARPATSSAVLIDWRHTLTPTELDLAKEPLTTASGAWSGCVRVGHAFGPILIFGMLGSLVVRHTVPKRAHIFSCSSEPVQRPLTPLAHSSDNSRFAFFLTRVSGSSFATTCRLLL